MNGRPMGFGPGGPDDDDDKTPDPMAEVFSQLIGPGGADELAKALGAAGVGPIDPGQLSAMIGQVRRMMSSPGDGGPVNWQLATDMARQAVAEHGDSTVGAPEQRAVADALRLADVWLEERTTLPAAAARPLAWSRAQWVEGTLPVWKRLVEPVAKSVSAAMAAAMMKQAPPELAAMMGSAEQIMHQVGGSVFGLQLGQAFVHKRIGRQHGHQVEATFQQTDAQTARALCLVQRLGITGVGDIQVRGDDDDTQGFMHGGFHATFAPSCPRKR